MSSFVEFTGETYVCKEELDVEFILNISKEVDVRGVFCSTDSKENIIQHEKKDKFLTIEIFFNTKGAPINKFKVKKVEVNEQFKNVEKYKTVNYKLANTKSFF